MKISYLGPEGTYCYGACKLYNKNNNYKMIKAETITEAVTLLLNDEVEECIVPIENSIRGTIWETLDAILENRNLKIIDEIILDIRSLFVV